MLKVKKHINDTFAYQHITMSQRETIIKQNKKIILQNDYATLIAVLMMGYIVIVSNKRGK